MKLLKNLFLILNCLFCCETFSSFNNKLEPKTSKTIEQLLKKHQEGNDQIFFYYRIGAHWQNPCTLETTQDEFKTTSKQLIKINKGLSLSTFLHSFTKKLAEETNKQQELKRKKAQELTEQQIKEKELFDRKKQEEEDKLKQLQQQQELQKKQEEDNRKKQEKELYDKNLNNFLNKTLLKNALGTDFFLAIINGQLHLNNPVTAIVTNVNTKINFIALNLTEKIIEKNKKENIFPKENNPNLIKQLIEEDNNESYKTIPNLLANIMHADNITAYAQSIYNTMCDIDFSLYRGTTNGIKTRNHITIDINQLNESEKHQLNLYITDRETLQDKQEKGLNLFIDNNLHSKTIEKRLLTKLTDNLKQYLLKSDLL